jgi:hypothetical protein
MIKSPIIDSNLMKRNKLEIMILKFLCKHFYIKNNLLFLFLGQYDFAL